MVRSRLKSSGLGQDRCAAGEPIPHVEAIRERIRGLDRLVQALSGPRWRGRARGDPRREDRRATARSEGVE